MSQSVLLSHSFQVLADPTWQPVSLSDIKAHLVIGYSADDALLTTLVTAATNYVERVTQTFIAERTIQLNLEYFGPVVWGDATLVAINKAFSGGIALELPVWPLNAINWIKYIDAGGTLQTWSSSLYQVWLQRRPPLFRPAYGQTYPVTQPGLLDAVQISLDVGYTSLGNVPPEYQVCIKQIVGHWYANKGDSKDMTASGIPSVAQHLLDYIGEPYYR